MEKKKVVIIGAGPAGLTSAYYLLKNSEEYEVIVLEQEGMVGGISKTISMNGYLVDTGIHRFFTKNVEVQKIWEEILPIQSKPAYDEVILNKKREYNYIGSNPEIDDKSMLVKDRITRIFYNNKFYDYPITLNYSTLQNLGFINIIKISFSYLKALIFKKKEKSLEDFYINKFGKVLYSMFFESYTEKVWGVHPSKMSSDWGAQRAKGISIIGVIKDFIKKKIGIKKDNNTEKSLIEYFIYPKLGAGQMYSEMAKQIEKMGGKIYLNSKVKSIIIKDNRVNKIIYEKDSKKEQIKVDICVESMPIKELFESIDGIEVPEDIYRIATKLPYRDFMSVCMVVDKINFSNTTSIKTLGASVPDSWIYIQDPSVEMGRIQIFNNWSPYIFKNKEDIAKKVLIGIEYFCSDTDKNWKMSEKEFINFVIEEAKKIKLIDNNTAIEEAMRIKIPRAYPAYFGTYRNVDKVIGYLNKISNLYCIGRNGQHRYNNMDHSMLTGIETAKNIINGIIDRKNIWNVNTDREYHEIKK